MLMPQLKYSAQLEYYRSGVRHVAPVEMYCAAFECSYSAVKAQCGAAEYMLKVRERLQASVFPGWCEYSSPTSIRIWVVRGLRDEPIATLFEEYLQGSICYSNEMN